ncbi:unnamed protein product [Schistosoma mattheei]|uniref:Uncharacterized protein n=1 Tax=Schistosoma mattheei TaxID=31246 RepID=A0A183PKW3_9TREM|nr:unnamed protein product [Schistosoma mattheei]
MYLLAHAKLHNTVVETARIDLQNFLKEYEWCYGSENLVYNVHSSQHLPDDVQAHGPLDSFLAFPFESYMRQIKDYLHSGFAVAKYSRITSTELETSPSTSESKHVSGAIADQ